MDTTFDPTPPTAPVERRQRTGRHVVAIVFGCVAMLPALGVLGGGVALAVAQAVAADDDGYFDVTLDRVQSDGVAVATADIWEDDMDEDGPWVFDMLDLDLRLRVAGAGSTENVFVGIARTADVEDYLAGAAYSEVTDIDDHTAEYRQVPGGELAGGSVGSPLDQDFWVARADGAGEQELTWNARGGRWSVVVMNADGSSDVAADIEVGARSDAVTPIAVTLIVLGGIGVLVNIGLIVFGVRGRRSPGTPWTAQPPLGSPLPPPVPDLTPAEPSTVDERHPTSVG